jgi:hypothetical protein
MPTGAKHFRVDLAASVAGPAVIDECRCTIGTEHDEHGNILDDVDVDDDGDDESLSVYDAADIWLSKGQDEDYMFGYSEDELRRSGWDASPSSSATGWPRTQSPQPPCSSPKSPRNSARLSPAGLSVTVHLSAVRSRMSL